MSIDDKFDKKEDRKKLGRSLLAGELASVVGSGIGAKIGERASGKLGGVIGGGIIGDYAVAWPVGALSYLYQNRDYYKGFKGKMEWLRDELEFSVRELPAVAASYVAYAPIMGLLYKGLGLSAAVAGGAASVLTSALYVGGAMLLGQGAFKKRKYKKAKQEKAVKEEPKADQQYAPGMSQREGYTAKG